MFASDTPPRTLDVPGMPGHTVTIRRLGAKALRDAAHALLIRAARLVRAEGWTAPVERYGGAEKVLEAIDRRPWLKYDPAVLIERGVVAWHPPRAEPPADHSELQAWLAKEIARFSVPDLVPDVPEGSDNAA